MFGDQINTRELKMRNNFGGSFGVDFHNKYVCSVAYMNLQNVLNMVRQFKHLVQALNFRDNCFYLIE